MSESSEAGLVRAIMTILHWAWTTKGQEEALENSIANWLFKNDDGISSASVLAERYLKDHDIDEVVGPVERGKIDAVRSEFTQSGFLHVSIWRTNGNAGHYTLGHDVEHIQNRILQVAVMQDRLAEYAYEEISVRYVDLDDLARAWHKGPRCRLSEVEKVAYTNFVKYVIEKKEQGIPLPCKEEDFRVEIVEVNDVQPN